MTKINNNKSSSIFLGKIVKNSIWNLFAYFAYTIITIISAPFYIHYLGISQYGLFTLLNSILAPLGLLNFGFGQSVIKYVSESYAIGDHKGVTEYIRTTLMFNILVGILGFLLISLGSTFLSLSIFKIPVDQQELAQKALIWIALGWVTTQITATLSGIPSALQKYDVVSIFTTIFNSLSLMVGLAALAFGGNLVDLIKYRFFWSLITIILWICIIRFILPNVTIYPWIYKIAFQKSFKFGIWQTIATVGGLLANQTDKILLGIYVSTTAVGFFTIPFTIWQVGYSIVSNLSNVLFPAISELDGQGNNERLVNVTIRSTSIISYVMVLIMGCMFIFSYDILKIYVGKDIADSSFRILMIFCFTGILSAPTIGIGQYLLGTAKTLWTAINNISSGLVTFLVSMILIPKIGLFGAAWSDMAAIILTRPLIHYFIWKSNLQSQITWKEMFMRLYGPSLSGVIITGLLWMIRNQLDYSANIFILIIEAGIGCAILVVCMYLVDYVMPGGMERQNDIKKIFALVILQPKNFLFHKFIREKQ